MSTLDILVVDDEALARRGMRILLGSIVAQPSIREASSGPEAIAMIRERRPDIVFLDVHLGRMDGFGVIDALGLASMPPVVFVTAYDRYAIRAFDAHAVDYLLKPVDPDRLREAVHRAMRVSERDERAALRRALDEVLQMLAKPRDAHLPEQREDDERIAIKDGNRTLFVVRNEIDWVESVGNYVRIHRRGGSETLRHRSTLDAFQSLLGDAFVRIRRSIIVRRGAIRSFVATGQGTYQIALYDQTTLTSSRHYRDAIAATEER